MKHMRYICGQGKSIYTMIPQFVNMSRCVSQEFETTEPPATQPKHASQNGYMIIHVSAQSCKHTYIVYIYIYTYIYIFIYTYIYIYIKYLISNILLY